MAERLQAALNEGRLTLSEYDERLKQTYAARTYGELDRLLDDLPATITGRDSVIPAQPSPVGVATPTPRPSGQSHWLQGIWGGWVTTAIICTVIYLLTDPGGYFWPVWVIVPAGVGLLLRTLGRAGGGNYRGTGGADRYERRRLRQQLRRDLRGR